MRKQASCLLLLLLSVSLVPLEKISAQPSPFVDDQMFRLLDNELSGDVAKDNLAILTRFHRPGGSAGFHQAAEFILQKAKEYGLEGAHLIRQASDSPSWTPKHSELWMLEPEEIKLADNLEVAVSLADYSPPADVKAELVDVGAGDLERDYQGKEVKGKIVLVSGRLDGVMREAVWKRGALGIVSDYSTRLNPLTDHPDQIAWSRVPSTPGPNGEPPTFAFVISPRTGLWLRGMLSGEPNRSYAGTGHSPAAQKIILHAKVDSEFAPEPWMEMIEYVIPGSEIHDQDIVLTGHLQEEKFSANDDGSGCVNVLEMARALTHLINTGKLPRPRRDIRFWWTTEIASEYRYFTDHPEERRQILVNINEDMVGANQSQDSRVQHITRTPYSLPSFLSDVVESIAESVILGNSSFLSVRQAQHIARGTVFSRPIFSRLGTRDRYNAMVVPYFDSTDHLVFCDSIIGIPGVTLTNWPDEYIHSSDDDLWNVDATQLKRNAFIVAAGALYVANASDASIPQLAADVYGRALERIQRDGRTALHLIGSSPSAERSNAYKAARNLIHQAIQREQKAVRSISILTASGGKNAPLLERLAQSISQQEERWMATPDQFYVAVSGQSSPPSLELSPRERALSQRIPKKVGAVGEYREAVRRIESVSDLHPLMEFEILNFVDGKNSFLDIFNAVSAESLSVGEFYYGRVTLDAVEQYLNHAVAAHAVAVMAP
jgi:hypothetical protein